MEINRYRFLIEYNGTAFEAGWQKQNKSSQKQLNVNLNNSIIQSANQKTRNIEIITQEGKDENLQDRQFKQVERAETGTADQATQRRTKALAPSSVQEVIENAAEKLTGFPVNFYCAGRTDKGVHALGQVAHADFNKPYPLKMLHDGLNFYLKNHKCRILAVTPVKSDFHARFSAKKKTYIYRINHTRTQSVFELDRSWWIPSSTTLDLLKIEKESLELIGHHDFSSFRDSSCQANSPMRTLESVGFEVLGEIIQLTFVSRSFLHKQIRIMVGTLIDLARGRFEQLKPILEAKNRGTAGQTAPGHGLFLKDIEYLD